MRVFALSDIHVDYDENARWLAALSLADYRDDVLILAGDVTDVLPLLEWCLTELARRFRQVLFVPGNHDIWVVRDGSAKTSLQKFEEVRRVAEARGVSTKPFRARGVSIIPLFGWYDYSFGEPSAELRSAWMDYRACRWPGGYTEKEITAHFTAMNDTDISIDGDTVITFSHFLPRIDVMPSFIPPAHRYLYPVLGSTLLDGQLRKLQASMHVYGHSHVNRRVTIDGVTYINNAFGNPNETRIAAKQLVCINFC
ncbi:MAG TPA: metallophosphoesterase [Thermoanaerobaculia bacterium]|nr:metallophosphoesterase [Thermoanaerobaculia bacterium]